MDTLRRIFGLGPAKQQTRPSYVEYTAPDGSARVRYVEDTTWSATAMKHNFNAIYGQANLPANFGMRGVVEVPDGNGNWTPVSGTTQLVPDMDAQLASLKSYYETGIIGAQPINPDGSLATPGGASTAAGQGGGAGAGAVEVGGGSAPAPTQGQSAAAAATQGPPSGGLVGQERYRNEAGLSPEQQLLVDALPEVMRNLPEQRRGQASQRLLDQLATQVLSESWQRVTTPRQDAPGESNAQEPSDKRAMMKSDRRDGAQEQSMRGGRPAQVPAISQHPASLRFY